MKDIKILKLKGTTNEVNNIFVHKKISNGEKGYNVYLFDQYGDMYSKGYKNTFEEVLSIVRKNGQKKLYLKK